MSVATAHPHDLYYCKGEHMASISILVSISSVFHVYKQVLLDDGVTVETFQLEVIPKVDTVNVLRKKIAERLNMIGKPTPMLNVHVKMKNRVLNPNQRLMQAGITHQGQVVQARIVKRMPYC
jgi:hypothetical protein